ncbi:cell division protein FtsZ [Pelagibacteraceae bacterium]|nr:cell division protein FtsZ [Pelagibacteraceae bacterium]
MTMRIGGGELKELKPRILVLGVGGAGGNAINAMIESGLQGVEFVAVNTDAQDLKMSKADARIQIGASLTKGLGAGAKHDIGQAAADESLNEIINFLQGANMVFITAGMGGGTGTGASSVIARAARELNILTVGVVTLPFSYEGPKRMRRAIEGMNALKKHLDTSIIVPNQNLFKVASETTTFEDSFHLSNDVLKFGVQSITDLMVKPGIINLDFADVETVMSSMGKAMMGTGEAEGENRAISATDMALNNPLIDDYSLKGAKGLLVNITGGKDITLFEVDQAVNKIRAEVDPEAELIFGAIKDESLNGKMRVSIVATALDGQVASTNGVVNMVNRIQNRNNGYSDGLFSTRGSTIPNNSYNTSVGATALKLEDQFEATSEPQQSYETAEQSAAQEETSLNLNEENEGVFSENMIQTPAEESLFEAESIEQVVQNDEEPLTLEEEYTPKLFSEENTSEEDNNSQVSEEQKLFEQEKNQEEDFEIPAFLRRQKF